MAITKLLHIKKQSSLHAAIAYVMNPKKTQGGLLVGGNSGNVPDEVYHTMMQTKADWEKPDGRQGYHFILSWKPGETDIQTAYRMVQEFCEEYLGDFYDYVFSVHNDRDHPHGHIVFNSVNRISGYKYRYEKGDWEKEIQPVTDWICDRHHVKPLEYDRENLVGVSYAEWNQSGKMTWKNIIRADIDYAISQAKDYGDFLHILRGMKYEIRTGISRMKGEEGEVLSLKVPGQKRAWRTKKRTLGEAYTVAAIRERIRLNQTDVWHYPVTPRLKRCRCRGRYRKNRSLSPYQLVFVREIYRVSVRYMQKNPFSVAPGQVRKNWMRIENLRRDCRYLIRSNIRSREELRKREGELRLLLAGNKQQRKIRSIQQSEPEYQEYVRLQKELKGTAAWDDRFENLLDQIEVLQEKLPLGMVEMDEAYKKMDEQLESIRQEQQIIRHIRKMDREWHSVRVESQNNRKELTDYHMPDGIQKFSRVERR